MYVLLFSTSNINISLGDIYFSSQMIYICLSGKDKMLFRTTLDNFVSIFL